MARKINIIIRLQHWMDSVPGQTFLNYAYSWGASIVILGALFKLTHLPGGNIMLFIGMGTEVVVFFLSAFDRPFDKSEIGKELPHDYETDEEIEARLRLEDGEDFPENEEELPENENAPMPHVAAVGGGTVIGGGEPFVGGNAGGAGGSVIIMGGAPAPQSGETAATEAPAATVASDPVEAARQAIALNTPEGAEPFENEAQRLAAIIRAANDELLRRAQAALSPEMEAATQEYIEKLQIGRAHV